MYTFGHTGSFRAKSSVLQVEIKPEALKLLIKTRLERQGPNFNAEAKSHMQTEGLELESSKARPSAPLAVAVISYAPGCNCFPSLSQWTASWTAGL